MQLFLNDKLIGEKPTGREQEFKAVFSVPYAPGTLKAVGLRGDRVVAESVLTTAGDSGQTAPDGGSNRGPGRRRRPFVRDGRGSGREGRPDLHADQEVQFAISGPGVIAAVGNGDGQDPDSYHGDRRKLYQGRALVVIRTSREAGRIKLTAKSSGLSDGSLTIDARAAQPRAELQ